MFNLFKLRDVGEEGNVKLEVSTAVITEFTNVTSKDHSDIHYLYKLRKALVLLVGEENLHGFSKQQVTDLHAAIVKSLIDNDRSHWYETYSDDLDNSLPEDLKKSSEGYYEPEEGILDLDDGHEGYRVLLEEHGAIELWTAPTARKKIPANHFLDPKNKKYPYKDSNGNVSCGGLMAAYKAARGARGAPKRPSIASKAKRLLKTHCNKEVGSKKAEIPMIGKFLNSGG